MSRIHTDILISGGGVAGLAAACAFGTAGFDVICVDPAPVITDANADGADLRSTAFLQPARNTLRDAGIWAHLERYAAPLQIMRLADAGGVENEIRKLADFDASEISDEPFGWNLPNWLLRREMLNRIEALENVRFIPQTALRRVTTRNDHALVNLDNGDQVSARLLIGADGRNSFVREALGINAQTKRYGQKALVFVVKHSQPHDDISTEIHRSGGPFTTVPMPDLDGAHYSSIVWMETGANASALAALNDAEFTAAAQDRSCDVLGKLTLASRRAIWPIITQQADHLIGQRSALIAEAAHVIPPIGAQGLNMSLADIETLLTLCMDHRDTFGSAEMLDQYQSIRHPDMARRIKGVDMLNRASMTDHDTLKSLRLKGLQALHHVTPLRQTLMKTGLGTD
ncbi:2-octaprenyl-6-methoxyphenyl hydroxylase [Amylibacter kogurei]|uniref:2-octaprenyl-6-methoxyphenyl hydroxylase n=1 Tax=Paramylibacter kogurei TaxID=1889778 RepID=A0A2G5K674_9RHOB|nr:UbiH/UbiF family hydroxylase [Amylibacter kogurei]PIB24522.1 2-octaprenyl-6-methoxyphenyl hydroxylase [Amylibacter kogurei]